MRGASILVAGAGAWGTALACELAHSGQPVLLWARDPVQRQALREDRENRRYLPGVRLPDAITVVDSLARLPTECTWALLATPCQTTREMAQHLHASAPGINALICTAKGLELGTQKLVHEVVNEVFGGGVSVAILSGPTFAREVAEGLPAAVTIATENPTYGQQILARLHSPRFRPYLTNDLTGVALGGSIKNVLAIAAGIADGLGLGANSRAALITRGLAEMARLGCAMGARQETFMGLSGLGDLVLTCTDDQSRNRRFGLALGGGRDAAAALASVGLVEGAATALALEDMALRFRVTLPIAHEVACVLRGEIGPQAAVAALMSRDPAPEFQRF
jgi:glycerol-3-phosphate dehydrogenase (NAD(P)+)